MSDTVKRESQPVGSTSRVDGASHLKPLMGAMMTLVGLSQLLVLGWAVIFRLEQWEARPFVLLIYGALACAGGASFWAHRHGEPSPGARVLRRMLWSFLSLVLLWVFFPPMTSVFHFLFRQISLFRFG